MPRPQPSLQVSLSLWNVGYMIDNLLIAGTSRGTLRRIDTRAFTRPMPPTTNPSSRLRQCGACRRYTTIRCSSKMVWHTLMLSKVRSPASLQVACRADWRLLGNTGRVDDYGFLSAVTAISTREGLIEKLCVAVRIHPFSLQVSHPSLQSNLYTCSATSK